MDPSEPLECRDIVLDRQPPGAGWGRSVLLTCLFLTLAVATWWFCQVWRLGVVETILAFVFAPGILTALVQQGLNAHAWSARMRMAGANHERLTDALEHALQAPQLSRGGLQAAVATLATGDQRTWANVVRIAPESELFELEPWEALSEPERLEPPSSDNWMAPVAIVGVYLLLCIQGIPWGAHAMFGGFSAAALIYAFASMTGVGRQKFVVPGGLVERRPHGTGARVKLVRAREANLVLVSLGDSWQTRVVSPEHGVWRMDLSDSEAERLLDGWLSPLEPPSLGQLESWANG